MKLTGAERAFLETTVGQSPFVGFENFPDLNLAFALSDKDYIDMEVDFTGTLRLEVNDAGRFAMRIAEPVGTNPTTSG